MSMSGMGLSTKPAASCSRARISKARSAGCAPMTASISPRPARASSRIMSSARSRGCWRHAPRRSRCRPNPRRPTPMRSPGQPAPRPLAGPILPLVASSVGTDQLLGGPGSRPAAVDALAARTLVKGEPLAAARRPRRRFRLATPRDRTRTGQGRNAGRGRCTRRDRSRCPRWDGCTRDRGDARATQAEETSANSVRPAGTARVVWRIWQRAAARRRRCSPRDRGHRATSDARPRSRVSSRAKAGWV